MGNVVRGTLNVFFSKPHFQLRRERFLEDYRTAIDCKLSTYLQYRIESIYLGFYGKFRIFRVVEKWRLPKETTFHVTEKY